MSLWTIVKATYEPLVVQNLKLAGHGAEMEINAEGFVTDDPTDSKPRQRKKWKRPSVTSISIAKTSGAIDPLDFEIQLGVIDIGGCETPGCINISF